MHPPETLSQYALLALVRCQRRLGGRTYQIIQDIDRITLPHGYMLTFTAKKAMQAMRVTGTAAPVKKCLVIPWKKNGKK